MLRLNLSLHQGDPPLTVTRLGGQVLTSVDVSEAI